MMRARGDGLSLERQRGLHARFGQHGTWRFLPWHRAELLHFEAIIAELTGHQRFALPYWDYQQTGELPAYFHDPSSAFFHPGRDQSGVNYADRRWGMSQAAANLFTDPFDEFVGMPFAAGRVEALGHNMVHGLIGGDMGNLSRAPLDPLFFLHHCNVDRVWATWHGRQPNNWPNRWLDETLNGFQGPQGPAGSVPVRNMLETQPLGYAYDAPYPAVTFSVLETAPEGFERREVLSTQTYRAAAEPTENGAHLSLVLPAELVTTVRGDSERLYQLRGAGTISYEAAGLPGQVVCVTAAGEQGSRPETLSASAALLPLPGEAHADAGDSHRHMDSFAHRFRFGVNVLALIRRTQGEVRLTSSLRPVQEGGGAGSARARSLDFEISLDRTRWIRAT